MTTKRLVVELELDVDEMLDAVCNKQQRTRKAVIRRMIEAQYRQDFGNASDQPQDAEASQ